MRRKQLVIRACTVAVTIALAAAGMRMISKQDVTECSTSYVQCASIDVASLVLAENSEQVAVGQDISKTIAFGTTSQIENNETTMNIQQPMESTLNVEDEMVANTVLAAADTTPMVPILATPQSVAKDSAIMVDADSSVNAPDTLPVSDAVLAAAIPSVSALPMIAATNSNTLNNEVTSSEEIIPEVSATEEVMEEPEQIEETEQNEYYNLVIAQVNDYVNVRDIPSTDGEIVGKLYDNSVGTLVEETEDGWYEITSGNVTGYVKAEYCVTGEDAVALVEDVGTRVATINTESLRVRNEASLDASVLGMVPLGEDLTVLEEVDGWVKISIEEGDGYVSTDYVDLRTDFVQAESKAEEEARLAKEAEARRAARAAAQTTTSSKNSTTVVPTITGDSEMGVAVAEYACQFVGNPYVFGGSSLTNGTDCSGFVMSVYSNFGVSMPHSSTSDRSQGAAVDSLENAQPGDVICYSGHVAIYIGNGQIVHASSKRTGIIISDASYKRILAIRRIF